MAWTRLSCALGPPTKADSTCRVPWLMRKREDSKAGKPRIPYHYNMLASQGFSCYIPLIFSRVLHRGGFLCLLPQQLSLEATFPSSAGFCSRCTSSWAGIRSGSHMSFCPSLHLLFSVRLREKKAAGRPLERWLRTQLLWSSYLGALCPCFPIQLTGNNINTHEQ